MQGENNEKCLGVKKSEKNKEEMKERVAERKREGTYFSHVFLYQTSVGNKIRMWWLMNNEQEIYKSLYSQN